MDFDSNLFIRKSFLKDNNVLAKKLLINSVEKSLMWVTNGRTHAFNRMIICVHFNASTKERETSVPMIHRLAVLRLQYLLLCPFTNGNTDSSKTEAKQLSTEIKREKIQLKNDCNDWVNSSQYGKLNWIIIIRKLIKGKFYLTYQ